MNGLSVSELCCLFCCPPCPSQIVAKLAFLPPPPTYKLIINGDQTYPNNNQASNIANNSNTSEQTALQQPANTPPPTNPNQAQPNQQDTNTRINNRHSSANNSSLGDFFRSIRNSSRLLCSSIVCSQRYSQQQANGQLLTQLHTNAKIVMMDKAEWQYGPIELEKLEVNDDFVGLAIRTLTY